MITASGKIIETYALTQEVTTCEEAAKAKGIPLKNELKTLIFSTSKGLHALHVPGNRKASLRNSKKCLKGQGGVFSRKREPASIVISTRDGLSPHRSRMASAPFSIPGSFGIRFCFHQ